MAKALYGNFYPKYQRFINNVIPGFNHNINHKGKTYHIQTEDSGVNSPHIITLLYNGGTILAREKTSYADIVKIDHLEEIVKDLMQDQHKKMLRKLIAGEFDADKKETPTKTVAEPEAPVETRNKDFGGDVISSKGLDEVMLDFLSDNLDEEGDS